MDTNDLVIGMLEIFSKETEKISKKEEGDYTNSDGILYCGKCKSAKQVKLTLPGGGIRIFPCICKCAYEASLHDKEQRALEDKIRRNYNESMIKTNDRLKTFENDDGSNGKQTAVMRRYTDNFDEMVKKRTGLLLYGDPGTGKSYYAYCIANELLRRGYSVKATCMPEIVRIIQADFAAKNDFIRDLCRPNLLIIDDFGVERGTEYMREIVYSVINERYLTGKPLVMTTNKDIGDFKKPSNVSEKRVYDRILEMCFPVKIECDNRRYKKIRERHEDVKKILGI